MHYQLLIKNITCKSCVEKITRLLKENLHADHVVFSEGNTRISFDSHQAIRIQDVNQLLATIGDYRVSEDFEVASVDDQAVASYKPIYLIFGYLVVVSLFNSMPNFEPDKLMTCFMAGFFLIFSFFKLLDLKSFAVTFRSNLHSSSRYH